jgi:hypothetical protein
VFLGVSANVTAAIFRASTGMSNKNVACAIRMLNITAEEIRCWNVENVAF